MNKSLDSQGIYTWYSFACNIFKEINLDISDFENFDKSFKNIKLSLKKGLNESHVTITNIRFLTNYHLLLTVQNYFFIAESKKNSK